MEYRVQGPFLGPSTRDTGIYIYKSFDISAEFSAKCAQRSRPVQTIAYLPARVIEETTARDLELATGPCCFLLLCIAMLSYVFMLS